LLELPRINTTVDEPPEVIDGGPNDFEIVGDVSPAVTVSIAVLLAAPTVVWLVVTPEVVFGLTATLVLVTEKVTVQLPFAGIVIPLKLSTVAPAVRFAGVVPAHVPPTAPPTALMLVRDSVKAPAVNGRPLPRVNVTVDEPPELIDAGLNAFEIVAAARTDRFAVLLAAPAVGVCVVVKPEVVFGLRATLVLVTAKVTVQLLLAGIVIPLKLNAVAPAVRLAGVIPTHVPPTAPPTALMFVRVSVKAPPLSAEALVLPRINTTVDEPPEVIDDGANDFEIVGDVGPAVTVSMAVLLTAPAVGVIAVVTPDVVLGFIPTLVLVTLKITVQLELAGIVMPVKLNAVAPAPRTAGVVPTQVPPTMPPTALMLERVSVNELPLNAKVLLLDNVRVTVEDPPVMIDAGLKALKIVGTPVFRL
jgi:hypothetical protein